MLATMRCEGAECFHTHTVSHKRYGSRTVSIQQRALNCYAIQVTMSVMVWACNIGIKQDVTMAMLCRVRERVSAMDVVPASLECAASLLAQAHGLDKPPNYVVQKHKQSVSTILLTWSEAPIRSTGTVEPRANISSQTEKYTQIWPAIGGRRALRICFMGSQELAILLSRCLANNQSSASLARLAKHPLSNRDIMGLNPSGGWFMSEALMALRTSRESLKMLLVSDASNRLTWDVQCCINRDLPTTKGTWKPHLRNRTHARKRHRCVRPTP